VAARPSRSDRPTPSTPGRSSNLLDLGEVFYGDKRVQGEQEATRDGGVEVGFGGLSTAREVRCRTTSPRGMLTCVHR
jgi:hypothetical protein